MSTVVKTAAFAAFFRLFFHSFSGSILMWSTTLSVLSALTILIGNLTAVYQKNFKRMLAYSSIAHAGYMLLAILAMNTSAAGSLFFYTTAYSISSISSFAILLIVSKSSGNDSMESFAGLAKRNPFLAVVTTVAMLSLAGIPPTAGFFAKYYIFSSALINHFTVLVLIAVLGSLIGVFYYFRIIITIFTNTGSEEIIPISPSFRTLLLVTTVIALVLGILPGLVVGLI
jgi:NADH-quinone oxidoreductase subunit N